MKDTVKHLIAWFCGLFNVGVYNMDDNMDSLLNKLFRLNLEVQAEEIANIQKVIVQQQHVLVFLDGAKCLLMLFSLLFLYLANSQEIHQFFDWCKTKIKTFYSFLKTKFKKNYGTN